MAEQLELKPIDEGYLPRALEKAERYRLLNWPQEAESICLDVLAVDPDNQRAIEILVLALADQFLEQGRAPRAKQAKQWVKKIASEYERAYLSGIIHEREGRAHLTRGFDTSFAYESFRDAMECYEEAQRKAEPGNQEAVLRHNSCVRTIERERLEPRDEDPVALLE
jgi:tetratricopeptide (TPR) repeat protein